MLVYPFEVSKFLFNKSLYIPVYYPGPAPVHRTNFFLSIFHPFSRNFMLFDAVFQNPDGSIFLKISFGCKQKTENLLTC
jgi:hypothetical protein